jgi:ribonuclease VapC
MVIDTSAMVAMLLREAEASELAEMVKLARTRLISAASLLETSIVIESRKGEPAGRELDLLIYRAGIEIIAVDPEQAELARHAWRRFGKGRHQAGLNFGDCFVYALAKSRGLAVLCLGHDFPQTDIACLSPNATSLPPRA